MVNPAQQIRTEKIIINNYNTVLIILRLRRYQRKMTSVKSISSKSLAPVAAIDEDNITVEQFLEMKFAELVKDFKEYTENLKNKLRQEYQDGVKQVASLMSQTTTEKKLCVNLRCISGPHMGQRFRLEATGGDEDVFKIGRSTGRLFKEKGVSLYKDKEISTTHAKIELRNGQAFLVDASSTNGTQLNNEDVEALTPLRLKEGDVVTVGSSELLVNISDADELESPIASI